MVEQIIHSYVDLEKRVWLIDYIPTPEQKKALDKTPYELISEFYEFAGTLE